MKTYALAFIRSEDGATLIEWSLIAALISMGAIACSAQFNSAVENFFGSVLQRAANAWPQ